MQRKTKKGKNILTINDSCVSLAGRYCEYLMLAQRFHRTECALVGNVIGDLKEQKHDMTETDS